MANVHLTRREFVIGSAAAGFALAARPLSAETVVTGASGLAAGAVRVPEKDGEIPAYRAMPAEGGPFPVVLVVHEIFGLHEHIRDICRRLAHAGYCAVAPDLYARYGDATRMQDIGQIVAEIVRRVSDAQVMADLDATVAWLRARPEADVERLGITGFCWGGRVVWMYAAHSPALKAGVAWYGRLVGEASDLTPKHPIDIAPSLRAPVLGLYGGADAGIPIETIERMRRELQKAGQPSQIVVYPHAPHAFHADYRPSYRKEAAVDGWKRMLAWFGKNGVGAAATSPGSSAGTR